VIGFGAFGFPTMTVMDVCSSAHYAPWH